MPAQGPNSDLLLMPPSYVCLPCWRRWDRVVWWWWVVSDRRKWCRAGLGWPGVVGRTLRRWGRLRGGTRCRSSWKWNGSHWTPKGPSSPWCRAGCPTEGTWTQLEKEIKKINISWQSDCNQGSLKIGSLLDTLIYNSWRIEKAEYESSHLQLLGSLNKGDFYYLTIKYYLHTVTMRLGNN